MKIKGGGGVGVEMKDKMNRFENELRGGGGGTLNFECIFRILYFNNDMENMQNVNLNHVFFFTLL